MKAKYEKLTDTCEKIEISKDNLTIKYLLTYDKETGVLPYRKVKADRIWKLRSTLNSFQQEQEILEEKFIAISAVKQVFPN